MPIPVTSPAKQSIQINIAPAHHCPAPQTGCRGGAGPACRQCPHGRDRDGDSQAVSPWCPPGPPGLPAETFLVPRLRKRAAGQEDRGTGGREDRRTGELLPAVQPGPFFRCSNKEPVSQLAQGFCSESFSPQTVISQLIVPSLCHCALRHRGLFQPCWKVTPRFPHCCPLPCSGSGPCSQPCRECMA